MKEIIKNNHFYLKTLFKINKNDIKQEKYDEILANRNNFINIKEYKLWKNKE